MAHVGYLSQEQQVQLFTGGLPEPIRTAVELQAPNDMQRAMLLARAYERRSASLPTTAATKPHRIPTKPLPSTTAHQSTPASSGPAANPSRPFKGLTPTEMAERRKLGLCYNCDEPYVRGHKCPRLFYLEVSDYEEVDLLLPADEREPENKPPMTSLHAITDIPHEETMKLHVAIGNHNLTTLVDSGLTHNFVNNQVAQHIGLQSQATRGANVVVANGDRLNYSGLASDVALCIGQECFSINCYTIYLDFYDMVLGISFLRTLGPILWDFEDLCMAFWWHGRRILWKGLGSKRWDVPSTRRIHSICKSDQPL
jgi:hypothetical protein